MSQQPSYQVIPRPQLPDQQRDLLAIYGQFLQAAGDHLASAGHLISRSPANFVLYALFLRLLQLGRSLQELAIEGYVAEGQPIARAMIGAALNIVLIAESDSDARALTFALFARRVRQKRLDAMVKHGHLTRQQAGALDSAEVKIEDQILGQFAAAGLVPAAPLGKNPSNWSGLSDHQLAQRFNHTDWYDLYYSPYSDAAHVNAAAVDKEVGQLIRGHVSSLPSITCAALHASTCPFRR